MTIGEILEDQGPDAEIADTPESVTAEIPESEPVETGDAGGEPAAAEVEAFTKLDPNALPEEAKAFYRQMQADYTRKTQEIAALRKQFESDQSYQTFRQLQEMAQTDPVRVAEYLRAQADALAAAQSQQVVDNSDSLDLDPDLMTPTERALYQQIEQLQQRLEQYQPTIQEAQIAQGEARAQVAFQQIESQVIGRNLSQQERDEIAGLAIQMGIAQAPDKMQALALAAKAWDYEKAQARAREQAQKTVQQRQAAATGSRPVAPGVGGGGAVKTNGRMGIADLFELAEAGKLS